MTRRKLALAVRISREMERLRDVLHSQVGQFSDDFCRIHSVGEHGHNGRHRDP